MGDAIMFCGYKPDIYDQLGPIAPEEFLDVWYRLMDKDADEVASFEDVKNWDIENDKPLFKYNEDLYREYVWSEYVGGDKSEITFQEAFDFYNSTGFKKAEFENGWYSLWLNYGIDSVTFDDVKGSFENNTDFKAKIEGWGFDSPEAFM